MYKRIAAVLFVCGGLVPNTAFSQQAPNPTQQPATRPADGQVPIFRVTVVGRTTPAVNYRPRKGDTKIDFAGTALLPQAKGDATVSGEQGYIKISAKFEKLEAPSRFGPEYLTYVLWAITPEGRASNLGEVQFDGDDAKVSVTTELQAFGMIVTAEPYFAVTQPSDAVVIENVVRSGRDGTEGSVEAIQAKYELLKRGTYLMNQDAASYKMKAREPGAPLDLAEARNAVTLAQYAGADKFAAETYTKAAKLLADAEAAMAARRGGNAIMMPARQAAQTAEDARLISLQKQEEAFTAEQRAQLVQRERDALDRAGAEAARRQQAELDAREATASRAAAERERAQAERERAEAQAARLAAEAAKTQAEAARGAADAARLAAEAQAQGAVANAEREKAELRAKLLQQLNVILETRETARGLIVNLSDVLFDTGSATLKAGAREKLARVSGVLLSHPGLNVAVEGHTDNVGTDSSNQRLSELRASSVQTYLVRQGIPQNAVATSGFGESQPVVTNDTAAGRQQNRRVELVVTGDAIGRRE